MPHNVEVPIEEEMQMLRDAMVVLLRRNPHSPLANQMGQRLMDLME